MIDELVKEKTAKLAKEKGLHIPESNYAYFKGNLQKCGGQIYNLQDRCEAPTQSSLQKYLREKYEIHIEIYCNASGYGYILTKLNGTTIKEIEDDVFFNTYENALEVGLEFALERI